MMSIVVSAPGKVILHGEHAVVYGKKAIALSLDIRTTVTLSYTTDGLVTFVAPNISVSKSWMTQDLNKLITRLHSVLDETERRQTFPCIAHNKYSGDEKPSCCNEGGVKCSSLMDVAGHSPCDKVVQELRGFVPVEDGEEDTHVLGLVAFLLFVTTLSPINGSVPSLHVAITSELPAGAGLGSSAAYSTCLVTALLCHQRAVPLPPPGHQGPWGWSEPSHLQLINAWAFLGERLIHGRPSGIDNAISCHGGGLVFQGGRISPLQKVPVIRVLLTNTKVPRSTKHLVAGVKVRCEQMPSVMNPILESIEAISERALEMMTSQECVQDEIETLVEINQCLLGALGVSHPSIDAIVQVTKKHGLATKLTGAGGGGCTYTLLPSDICNTKLAQVQQELSVLGYDCWVTTLGGAGVTLHEGS